MRMFTRKPTAEDDRGFHDMLPPVLPANAAGVHVTAASPVFSTSAPQTARAMPAMPAGAAKPKLSNDSVAHGDGVVVIGKGTRVHGRIGDCRTLDVHGVLEGEVVTDLLIVRAGGGFKGNVQTDNAQVHGVFEGTLVVHEHLDIENTGHVTGDISYRSLSIQTGARLRGNILCTEPDNETEAPVGDPSPTADIIPLNNPQQEDSTPEPRTKAFT